ncbi:hypothetical protein M9Y10_003665 [Tritrichomonas musculus]|uniref:UDENN domain-containing protein n=1 Tax=Tritrichomonas musculus TaxID=1915356 RepID=A0ABR2JQJ9_9EUKA
MYSRRLSVTNEVKVQRSLQNKRLASEIEERIPKIRKSQKMFDQFLIMGAPLKFEEQSPEPVILASYPRVSKFTRPDSEVLMLLSFAFPNGFSKIRPDTTGLRTILTEFVFFLKEEADTIYGICVQFRGNDKLFFASEQNLEYPFCYCLLTFTPFISAHFTFLSYLSLLMVKRINSIPHVNTENEVPLPVLTEEIFAHLVPDKNFPHVTVLPGLNATQELRDELLFYYSLPTKAKDVNPYPKIPLSPKINLCLPLHLTKNQCFAYSSFHSLFNTFKISEIVTIYTAILLEMRVVFISKRDLHLLSMSLISIITLFKPFKSKSTIILPILPSKPFFLQILDSPVPYVIGTTSQTRDADLIVNIDSFEITANTNIPLLPQRNELISKLINIISTNGKKCTIPQCDVNGDKPLCPEFIKFVDNYNPYNFPFIYISLIKLTYIFPPNIVDTIIDVFRNHITPSLTETINSCLVTDNSDPHKPVTICNIGLFLCQVPDCDREFYEKFTQTNTWETYCDKLSEIRNKMIKEQSNT